MGVAIWAAYRQIEALRESVAFTLEDGAIEKNKKSDREEFAKWLRDQGVEPEILTIRDFETDQEIGEEVYLLLSMEKFFDERYSDAPAFKDEKRYSKYNDSDFGVYRSSAGWDSLPNFVITSALVRLLGALEQFELDVLKALLYYRPVGNEKGKPLHESDVVTVTSEVLTEEPDKEGAYARPTIWRWIKKSAENNVERMKIFKQIYDIDTTPQQFNGKNPSDINKYKKDLYEKRNAIAHGRANVKMLLSDYCTAEIFVIETIRTISQQCLDKLKVSL